MLGQRFQNLSSSFFFSSRKTQPLFVYSTVSASGVMVQKENLFLFYFGLEDK
jgi:hypothetical protein